MLVFLIGIIDQSFAQVIHDKILTENSSNSINLKNNTKFELDESEQITMNVAKITHELEEIKNKLDDHDALSSFVGYSSMIFGIIFGIYGFLLTLQERKSRKIRKIQEDADISKINNHIKNSIGVLYENIKNLPEPTMPYSEHYKNLLISSVDDIKTMNAVASSSPYTDESLRHTIIGYTMFLEKQITRIQNDQKILQRVIVGATKRIIDTYFPEHHSEHEGWLQHMEEESERIRQEHEKEYIKWYAEQEDSGIFDEVDDENTII